MLGGRVHQYGDERFTWAEDEDHKQDPGCYAGGGALVVDVDMLSVVGVGVLMFGLVSVVMDVGMGFVPVCLSQAPCTIGESEGDECCL